MLGQLLRRWSNIQPALGECCVIWAITYQVIRLIRACVCRGSRGRRSGVPHGFGVPASVTFSGSRLLPALVEQEGFSMLGLELSSQGSLLSVSSQSCSVLVATQGVEPTSESIKHISPLGGEQIPHALQRATGKRGARGTVLCTREGRVRRHTGARVRPSTDTLIQTLPQGDHRGTSRRLE